MTGYFNPLPPQGGRLVHYTPVLLYGGISIHSLPKEGDTAPRCLRTYTAGFQSTPSPRRETKHYLRCRLMWRHFNPLPPQGGRHCKLRCKDADEPFQSTPSPRRETHLPDLLPAVRQISIHSLPKEGDAKRAKSAAGDKNISIHSLPKEGDGRTVIPEHRKTDISIHSLPKEGDLDALMEVKGIKISIHSLPKEGDSVPFGDGYNCKNFNPLPPQGGRPIDFISLSSSIAFQSTPSPRRETAKYHNKSPFSQEKIVIF